ncbi:MAG: hypothetical protein NTU75_07390, partial [Sphingomonadales bacterium]|nr:hypothetical protein [Sphingomonadales bacterium]
MSLAMKRLQNIGWLALVFMVAILLYPLSLNVAAMHSNLVAVDRNILETKREISFLQAEIRTRASLQQLEEWNELLYGYQPPMANQFVSGEAALAELTGDLQATKPVMMASADIDAAPSANQANPAPTIEAVVKKSTEIATAVAAPIFAEPVKRAAPKP